MMNTTLLYASGVVCTPTVILTALHHAALLMVTDTFSNVPNSNILAKGAIMRRMTETDMDERYGSPDIDEVNKKYLRELTEGLEDDELRLLRSIINGKLGKRKISAEQQAKMQAARKRKVI